MKMVLTICQKMAYFNTQNGGKLKML